MWLCSEKWLWKRHTFNQWMCCLLQEIWVRYVSFTDKNNTLFLYFLLCWQHRNYTALGKVANSPLVHAPSTAQVINFNHWILIACAWRLSWFSYLGLDLLSCPLEILGRFFQWCSGHSAGNLTLHFLSACPLWAGISAQWWPRHTTHRFGCTSNVPTLALLPSSWVRKCHAWDLRYPVGYVPLAHLSCKIK